MRTLRVRKLLGTSLALLLLAGLWLCFAPSAVGGSTSYVVTDGISMEPRFHSGDLALVRSQSSYRVGEIVAYHSRVLHTVVLHRIVRREGSRYVFKGDNNNFLDFEHPAASQLIGALWVHLPGAGARLTSLRSPWLIGALIAIGTLMLGGAAFASRRGRRRRQRRAATGETVPAPRSPDGPMPGRLVTILLTGLVATLPFLALAVAAFTRPATALQPTNLGYRQSGKLSYAARAAPGPAYAGNRAVTGQPLFTHVLSAVRLSYSYRFGASARHALAGRGRLLATITSTSGWQTSLPLGPPSLFRADHAVIGGTLDLAALASLLHRVETTTAVSGTYTLTIVGQVSIGGSLGAIPVHASFSQSVPFALNRLEVRPVAPSGAAASAGGARSLFEHAASGTASGRSYQPTTLSLRLLRLPTSAARSVSLGAIVLIVVLMAAAGMAVRPRRRSAGEDIRLRLGAQVVPVACVWQQPGVPVIDVEDVDSLARIAAHYDRSILHELADYGEVFWVSDESGQFRYVVPAEPEPVERRLMPVEQQQAPVEQWQAPVEGPRVEPESEAVTATHRAVPEQLGGWHAPAY
jgi:signal peptidase I